MHASQVVINPVRLLTAGHSCTARIPGEEKYRWSKYIAEPVNTTTNLFFFLLAMYGARKSRQEGLPLRFTLVNLVRQAGRQEAEWPADVV